MQHSHNQGLGGVRNHTNDQGKMVKTGRLLHERLQGILIKYNIQRKQGQTPINIICK